MGFGGVHVVNGLSGKGLDVTVLDRRNFHLFQPLLYQVSTAMIDQEAVAYPIRAILRKRKDVRFVMSSVESIDLENKRVLTVDGPLDYDYLVLAAGSVTNFFGLDSVQEHAFDLKQLNDAVSLRNHILNMYEQAVKEIDPKVREALMTFVVVGGGPTGVEFAGSLSELTHHVLTKDFPELHPGKSRIVMLEAMDRLLAPFPAELQQYTLQKLEKMGVEVRLNTAVTGATHHSVQLNDGSEIGSHTLFWAAGVKASPLADALLVEKVRGGRVPVEADLSLKDHPEVFIIGDMAYREQDGAPLPGVAQVAMQGGDYVAKVIRARERGKQVTPFRYINMGSMAVIGRHSAVADIGGLKLKGFVAWLAWLGLHLFYLIGFRNRVVTLLNWAYEYFRYNRQVRLITSEPNETRMLPTRFAPEVTAHTANITKPDDHDTNPESKAVTTTGSSKPLCRAKTPAVTKATRAGVAPLPSTALADQ
jgi:NADH dehydrogenase